MRTTLVIDDDILLAARELAAAERRTIGQVISELARRALTHSAAPGSSAAADDDLFPRFPKRGGPPVTNELVRRIQEKLDLEDAIPFDHTTGRPRSFSDDD
jgi:hypothetical protein